MLVALDQGNERSEKQEIDNAKLVYLSPELQTALLALEKVLVDHEWSLAFKRLCQDIEHEGDIAEYSSMMCVVDECLASIALHECNAPLDSIRSDIEEYKTKLILGDLYVEPSDMNVDENHYKSSKFKRDLTVGFLAVNHALIVNGFEIVNGTLSVNGTLLINGSPVGTGNVASVTGGTGITITGSTANPIVNLTVPVSIADGGTNATSMTNANGVVYYDGTLLNTTAVGIAGQILTSRGPGLSPIFVTGSGGSGISDIDGNTGSISGSMVTIEGGNNITTSGDGSTTMTVSVSGTTNHAVQIGNSTGSLSSVAVGATNTVLLGNTGADPSFGTVPNAALTNSSITLNSGTGISVTGSPVSLGGSATINLSTPVSIANGGTNATSMTNTDGVVYYDGTKLNTTTVGTAGQLLTSNGTGNAPTFQTLATSIETINGNTGSISGSTVTIEGGNNITTSGSGSTMTVSVSGTTNHAVQIGNSTGSLSSVAVGATNTVLLGNTGADPSFGTVPNAALTNSSITLNSGTGISVTGSPVSLGGSATINLSTPVSVANGGTGATTLTSNGVLLGSGTSPITATTAGTAGQVLLGSAGAPSFITPTAGSGLSVTANATTLSYAIAAPVSIANGGTNATSMTNADGVVYYDGTKLNTTTVGTAGQLLTSNGTGNAPTFQTLATSIETINGNTGSISGSTVTIEGGNNITTSGSGSTMTVSVSGTTNHAVQIGNSTGSLSSVAVGATNTVLLGNTGADPSFGTVPNAALTNSSITLNSGTGISVTGSPVSLGGSATIALSTPVSIANGGTNATSMTNTDGVVYYDGTKLNTTTVGTAGQLLTSNGTGNAPTFQTLATSIETINGNTGSISGSTVTIEGGNNITTSGSAATMTVNVSGTTNHAVQIGNSSGSLSSVAVGATNTVLLGNTGADPSFGTVPNAALTNSSITLNSGTGISVTGSPVSLGGSATIALSTPVSIANGGTNATSMTNTDGVVYYDGTLLNTTAVGTAGQILTSNGTGNAPTFQTFTISNDSGSVSGISLSLDATTGSGGTVKFSGSGTAMALSVSDGSGNTAVGKLAGNATMGTFNTAFGEAAGRTMSGASGNCAFGFSALVAFSGAGNNNCAFGMGALQSLVSGSGNIAIGQDAGNNLGGSESNNIYLNSNGVALESGVLRIGGTTSAFIAGISGVTVTGATVLVSSAGQLGVAVSSRNYKKNIKDIISSNVLDLRPVTFNYKDREWADETHYGLIAEEVADIMPDLVIYDNNKEPQTVKYHELPVLLLARLKVLADEVEILKAKVATLESQ